MTLLAQPRWLVRAWAGLLGYRWAPCPFCGVPFGNQERGVTEHFDTVPGGENDHRLICPVCTDAGVGCLAHRDSLHHDGCEYVTDDEPAPEPVWPADDTDSGARRSGPYVLESDGEKTHPQGIRVVDIGPPAPAPGRHRLDEATVMRTVLARHAELVADAQSEVLRDELDKHKPIPVDGRLVCAGCAPTPLWMVATSVVLLAELPDAPCSAWKTMDALNRRDG